MQILIVEDEQNVAALIRSSLELEGYTCTLAHDGLTALEVFNQYHPDIVILDWNIPLLSGIDVCEKIRQTAHNNPLIMMLTGKGAEGDRITGYAVGADDYFTKPFSPSELIVRIRALLKRTTRLDTGQSVIKTPHFIIDPACREVRICQDSQSIYEQVAMSLVEFNLLYALAKTPKIIYSRSQLLDVVKGEDFIGDERAIDSYIKRIRDKISPTQREKFIRTHLRVGYSFLDSGFDD